MHPFKNQFIHILLAVIFIGLSVQPSTAYEPPRSALMIDVSSNKTLFADAPNAIRHPASLTKMMTLYMLFEALRDKKITMQTLVTGSRHSADRPPSRLGLAKGETIPVDLAIDALVVRSANDVAAAVAELLAGSEEAFAEKMTVKARQLGMKNTVYHNASGLPDKEQVTTASDQAVLGLALKSDFPEYFPRFSVPTVTYKDRTWNSHNNLIKKVDTVTGIKTGFINASGFNVVTYVEPEEGDKIIVVMGGRTAKERDQIAIDLLEGRKPFYQLNEAERIARTNEIAARKKAVKLATAKKAAEEQRIAKADEEREAQAQAAKIVAETVATPAPEVITETPPVEVAALAAEPEIVAGTVPEAQPVASDTIKRYAIQVGALPSQERAMERLALARPELDAGKKVLRQYTLPLDTSRGTVYRARIIGFDSMQAAFDACEIMESKEIECMALIQK